MKFLLVFIFLISTNVYANDLKIGSAIFNKVVLAMIKTDKPKIYIHTKNTTLSKYPGDLQIVSECKDADVVVLSTLKGLPECKDKVLFGTRYKHLREKRVVGAFFWQKGRPNILFYKTRLEQYNISLDSSFEKYIENDE